MQNGTVIKMNEKGFGFIKVDGAPEGSKDLFFHSNELKNISFAELKEETRSRLRSATARKGPNASQRQQGLIKPSKKRPAKSGTFFVILSHIMSSSLAPNKGKNLETVVEGRPILAAPYQDAAHRGWGQSNGAS